jgi:stage II sporulation protein AA (anti-sigma F factor antagonist)
MANEAGAYVRWEDAGGILVARVVAHDIRHPPQAQELSRELAEGLREYGPTRLVIDLRDVKYLGSAAFGVLVNLGQKMRASGGQVKLCGLHPEVQIGANIIGLGRVVEIHDDERAALASFQ